MLYFLISVAALVVGHFVYGTLVDRLFGSDPDRATPAITKEDGIDFIPLPPAKIFLIQLLNIAGLGPIFGAILGALYGPVALLWIVLGNIFAGAVHDYFSGMLSLRSGGDSVPEIVGENLGNVFKQFMRGFSVVLLLLVGIVFVAGPAGLLKNLTNLDASIWVGIIFVYYFLATILPVDKIIGKVYPFFGAVLIFMAVGLTVTFIAKGHLFFPERTLGNINPQGLPLWPLLFITIACGAISGFHATQSPMMARCLPNEKYGRNVFYGAMVAEGIIALIWASLAMSFFSGTAALDDVLAKGGPALVVDQVSRSLLGGFGGILAIIGVVLLPITSGDTAFRSARLIIADSFSISQKKTIKRLSIAVPLFVVGFIVSRVDFGVLWRYFGWANQTLATVVLWASAAWLVRNGKLHWIATIPAVFMTAVIMTFISYAKIGFRLPMGTATAIGIAAAIGALLWFLVFAGRLRASSRKEAAS